MKDYVAPIQRDEIARLIPHAGAMCLLDCVVSWDETSVRCVSTRHRAKDNPLRQAGRIGVLCGVEFAAQAMAVHGRLAGAIGARPRAGYLASVREVVCGCDRLDQFDGALIIEAMRVMGDEERVIYSFSITFDGRTLVSGRATVILQAESSP